jgi:hypothetical protein
MRKEHEYAHPIVMSVQELLRKTSVIGSIKVKGMGGRSGDRAMRSGSISLDLLPNFFSPRKNFPELDGENSETQSKEKRRPRSRVDHLHQLPTGQWMNFLLIAHELTPYSDAHVRASCNLIQVHAFPMQNTRDASTLPYVLPLESVLLTRKPLSINLL